MMNKLGSGQLAELTLKCMQVIGEAVEQNNMQGAAQGFRDLT